MNDKTSKFGVGTGNVGQLSDKKGPGFKKGTENVFDTMAALQQRGIVFDKVASKSVEK